MCRDIWRPDSMISSLFTRKRCTAGITTSPPAGIQTQVVLVKWFMDSNSGKRLHLLQHVAFRWAVRQRKSKTSTLNVIPTPSSRGRWIRVAMEGTATREQREFELNAWSGERLSECCSVMNNCRCQDYWTDITRTAHFRTPHEYAAIYSTPCSASLNVAEYHECIQAETGR